MSENFFQAGIFLVYLLFLFFLIYLTGKRKKEFSANTNTWIYAFAISASFFSGWTFIGIPSFFLKNDLLFISYHVGIVLFSLLFPFLLERIYKIIERYNVNDLVSFVIFRYENRKALKWLVLFLVVFTAIPYLTLNIKSLDVVLNPRQSSFNIPLLFIALILLFIFVYRIRGWKSTTALATQGLFMILSCLILGIFFLFFVFHGPADLFSTIQSSPFYEKITLRTEGQGYHWWHINMLLTVFAFIFLPRQFSIIAQGINLDKKQKIFKTSVVLIVFLCICQLFYTTVVGGGFLAETIDLSDKKMNYPVFREDFTSFFNQVQNHPLIYIVFLMGGFSFAISTINQELSAFGEILKKHLNVKYTLSIIGGLAACFFLTILLKDFSLDRLGILAFLGVFQLAVPILGGFLWKNANYRGAIAGLSVGLFFWVWFGWLNFLSDPSNFIHGMPLFSKEIFNLFSINLLGEADYLWLAFSHSVFFNILFFIVFSISGCRKRDVPAAYLGEEEDIEEQKDFESILKFFNYDMETIEVFLIIYNNRELNYSVQEIKEYVKNGDIHEKLMFLYNKGLIQQVRQKNRLYYAYNPEMTTDFKFDLFFKNFFTFRYLLEKMTESVRESKKKTEIQLGYMQILYRIYVEILSIHDKKEFFPGLAKILSAYYPDIVKIEYLKGDKKKPLFVKSGANEKKLTEFLFDLDKEALSVFFREKVKSEKYMGIENFFVLEPVVKVCYKLLVYIAKLKKNALRLKNIDSIRATFIANISHELRTPMLPIKGYLNVLSKNKSIQEQPDLKEMVASMFESYKRLEGLIENLISFKENRLDYLKLKSFWIYDLLFGAIMDMKEIIDTKEIKVKIRERDFMGAAMEGDKEKLKIALMQIIDNAVKFNRFQGKIIFKCQERGNYYILKIMDNGIGIKPEVLKNLFEPFYQADSKDTKNYQGAGLGLSVVRKILKLHGGAIHLKSEEGKGTIAILRLPKKSAPEEEL